MQEFYLLPFGIQTKFAVVTAVIRRFRNRIQVHNVLA
jgi:hypothetical protein